MKWITNPVNNYNFIHWKKWFAWHPVRINQYETVWFQIILRRQVLDKKYSVFDKIISEAPYYYKESIFDILRDNYGNEIPDK